MSNSLKKTALFTWEIGLGFGHVMPMLPIARELKALGWRCVFALRDVREAGGLLAQEGFEVFQAPFHADRKFKPTDIQPETMADVLEVFGFSHEQHLAGLAYAWNCLMDLINPQLLVASYAPLSFICAKARRVKTHLLALPFELPPLRDPLPSFRDPSKKVGGQTDARIVKTINAVFPSLKLKALKDIYAVDQTDLLCWKELDAFAEFRDQATKYAGPVYMTDMGDEPQWIETGKPKVFAYLTTELMFLEKVRQSILQCQQDYEFLVFLRGASDQELAQWQASNIRTVNRSMKLGKALEQAQAVISYGGMGMTSAALMAGKPAVYITRDLEGFQTAQQVEKLGAGLHINQRRGVSLNVLLSRVVSQPEFTLAAQKFARKYAAHQSAKVSHHILQSLSDIPGLRVAIDLKQQQ